MADKENVNDATGTIGANTLISGAQWKDFYKNHFPKDWYVEDMPFDIEDENGNVIIADERMVKLGDLGWACWQGSSDAAPARTTIDMSELYANVMGHESENVFVGLSVPREKLAEMLAFVDQFGIAIVGDRPGDGRSISDEEPDL